MSEWVSTHLPCDKCGSSDAYSINDRGWGTCFSCGHSKKEHDGDDEEEDETGRSQSTRGTKRMTASSKDLMPFGEYQALSKRKINEESCRKFGYSVSELGNEVVQVATYRDSSGAAIAQKIRSAGKKFSTRGDFKNAPLYGQHLWKEGGKKLVITEGEIDCLSMSQVQDHKWPVVSLPNGCGGAVKAIKRELEFVMSFDEVVLMFDMDEVGQEAAIAVAELLPVGKARIASLDLKDPNEMLIAGRLTELRSSVWNAKEYRPDGIVEIDDILDEIEKPVELGLPWWLPDLTELTYGRRMGEIYGLGAGTGVGKTDFFTQQAAYDITELKKPIGAIFLESKPVEVSKRIAGKIDGQRYHVPNGNWDKATLKSTVREKLSGMVTFYDSWGGTDWEHIEAKIRFMVISKGIKLIYLDHLTAMADPEHERESIEKIMKKMATLAVELSCIIHFISHLSSPEGKSHEEGGRVTIKNFKGSRSIGFWSHFMFGMERDQQHEDEEEKETTTFRVLKDRYTGQATGKTIRLGYDHEEGRLYTKQGTENHGFSGNTASCDFDTDHLTGGDSSSNAF